MRAVGSHECNGEALDVIADTMGNRPQLYVGSESEDERSLQRVE